MAAVLEGDGLIFDDADLIESGQVLAPLGAGDDGFTDLRLPRPEHALDLPLRLCSVGWPRRAEAWWFCPQAREKR